MGCNGSPAIGAFGKLIIEPGLGPYTFDIDSERYEILPDGRSAAEQIIKRQRLIGGQGIWGGLYPLSTRTVYGGHYVYGDFQLNPSPGYLDTLLKYMVGNEGIGGDEDTFFSDDCPNPFGMLIYRDMEGDEQESFEIQGAYIPWWELTVRQTQHGVGEGIDDSPPDLAVLKLGIVALDEGSQSWPDPEPPIPEGPTYYPYSMANLTDVTVNGAQRKVYGFRLRYDRRLAVEYASGSTAPNSIYPTGRRIQLDMQLPWTDENDDLYTYGYEGAPASFGFTMGDYGTTFHVTNFKAPPRSPHIVNRDRVSFTVRGQAFGAASDNDLNKEFRVTNDVTV